MKAGGSKAARRRRAAQRPLEGRGGGARGRVRNRNQHGRSEPDALPQVIVIPDVIDSLRARGWLTEDMVTTLRRLEAIWERTGLRAAGVGALDGAGGRSTPQVADQISAAQEAAEMDWHSAMRALDGRELGLVRALVVDQVTPRQDQLRTLWEALWAIGRLWRESAALRNE